MSAPVIDHWLWAAMGFQGLTSMLKDLDASDVPITSAALSRLIEYRNKLNEIIDHQQQKQEKP
jgi:hypothetical protein